MKYAKPQIVRVDQAVDVIQSIQAAKPGAFNDGLQATSPAYEADE
jgi:hypothetical protein